MGFWNSLPVQWRVFSHAGHSPIDFGTRFVNPRGMPLLAKSGIVKMSAPGMQDTDLKTGKLLAGVVCPALDKLRRA